MAKESEQMRLLKENFMELHEQGYSIPEIAEKFNLSFSEVYRKLQEIADANNVKRKVLLQYEKAPSERTILREEERKAKVTVEELRQGLRDAGEIIDFLIDEIGEVLKNEREQEEEIHQ